MKEPIPICLITFLLSGPVLSSFQPCLYGTGQGRLHQCFPHISIWTILHSRVPKGPRENADICSRYQGTNSTCRTQGEPSHRRAAFPQARAFASEAELPLFSVASPRIVSLVGFLSSTQFPTRRHDVVGNVHCSNHRNGDTVDVLRPGTHDTMDRGVWLFGICADGLGRNVHRNRHTGDMFGGFHHAEILLGRVGQLAARDGAGSHGGYILLSLWLSGRDPRHLLTGHWVPDQLCPGLEHHKLLQFPRAYLGLLSLVSLDCVWSCKGHASMVC
jgi:hypothetical protein